MSYLLWQRRMEVFALRLRRREICLEWVKGQDHDRNTTHMKRYGLRV